VIAAAGAGLAVGVLLSAVFGAALLLYARRRGRTVIGVEGLIATFLLGTLFGVLVATAVAAVFAFALRRLPPVGSDA
jgi:RsiW-degrading membrane proteinase PrsW (M82 family)